MPAARKTGEVHFNTEAQVRDYTSQALEIAAGLDLSPDDRAVLLPQIMQQLASKQVFMEQVQVSPHGILTPNGAV